MFKLMFFWYKMKSVTLKIAPHRSERSSMFQARPVIHLISDLLLMKSVYSSESHPCSGLYQTSADRVTESTIHYKTGIFILSYHPQTQLCFRYRNWTETLDKRKSNADVFGSHLFKLSNEKFERLVGLLCEIVIVSVHKYNIIMWRLNMTSWRHFIQVLENHCHLGLLYCERLGSLIPLNARKVDAILYVSIFKHFYPQHPKDGGR